MVLKQLSPCPQRLSVPAQLAAPSSSASTVDSTVVDRNKVNSAGEGSGFNEVRTAMSSMSTKRNPSGENKYPCQTYLPYDSACAALRIPRFLRTASTWGGRDWPPRTLNSSILGISAKCFLFSPSSFVMRPVSPIYHFHLFRESRTLAHGQFIREGEEFKILGTSSRGTRDTWRGLSSVKERASLTT